MCIVVPCPTPAEIGDSSKVHEHNKSVRKPRRNPRRRRGGSSTAIKENVADREAVVETDEIDNHNIPAQDIPVQSIVEKGKRRRRRRGRGKGGKNKISETSDESSSGDGTTSDSGSASDSGGAAPLHLTRDSDTSPKIKKVRKRSSKKKKAEPIHLIIDDTTEVEKLQHVAIDCEMVGTGSDGLISALARVSLVDWYGQSIFDTYVQVSETVTDYRTFVSGITHQNVESDEAISFEECRKTILDLIKGRIVVGHGLKNDFRVLKIDHPWYAIRDSARYEPLMKCDQSYPGILLPRKLKELASVYAQMNIQIEGKQHCSVEDATAAMMVFRAKKSKWEKSIEWKLQKTNLMNGTRSDISI